VNNWYIVGNYYVFDVIFMSNHVKEYILMFINEWLWSF